MSVFAINEDSLKIVLLNSHLEILQNEVKQVRANQLNYKIEKETLKEVYASNLDKAEYGTYIVFGLATLFSISFGIATFIGFRSADKTKKEIEKELTVLKVQKQEFDVEYKEFNSKIKKVEKFREELDNLKNQKKEFESEYQDFKSKREEFDDRITKVEENNDKLDRKIILLNLLDRAITAYNAQEYLLAYSYLENLTDEQNELIISYQIKSLKGLNRDNETIKLYYKLLDFAYHKKQYLFELCELLLINEKVEEYEVLTEKYRDIFQYMDAYLGASNSPNKGLHILYLYTRSLYFLKKEDKENLKNIYEKLSRFEGGIHTLMPGPHPNPFFGYYDLKHLALLLDTLSDDGSEVIYNFKQITSLLMYKRV